MGKMRINSLTDGRELHFTKLLLCLKIFLKTTLPQFYKYISLRSDLDPDFLRPESYTTWGSLLWKEWKTIKNIKLVIKVNIYVKTESLKFMLHYLDSKSTLWAASIGKFFIVFIYKDINSPLPSSLWKYTRSSQLYIHQ